MAETRSETLDRVNDAFHAAYDAVRARAELDAPVIVVLSDSLVLVHHRRRRELPLTPPMFTVVKSVAHAPVALHALLHREGDALDAATLAAVGELREKLVHAAREVGTDAEAASRGVAPRPVDRMTDDMRAVLRMTSSLAAKALAAGRVGAEELATFARDVGAIVLRLTEDATRLQLEALHACVEEAIADLDAHARSTLEVVVIGAHQARARSYGMQYFQKRLGEADGVEHRVAYAESVETEEEAVALIGTRRLDRAIAEAFFGDPKRLQRDVLGDAAAHVLAAMKLPPL